MRALALTVLLLGAGCASAPARPSQPPALGPAQLVLAAQALTRAEVRFEAPLSATTPATLERARWELVVEGEVVERGETPLGLALVPGVPTEVSLPATLPWARGPDELRALSEEGGSVRVALRGELQVRSAAGASHALPFAASREVRRPRLPTVSLARVDAARYSTGEVRLQLGLGVANPNPFPVSLTALTYRVSVAGRALGEGARAQHDTLAAAQTALYEVEAEASRATHGGELAPLLRAGVLPYRVEGELSGPLFRVPYVLEGSARHSAGR